MPGSIHRRPRRAFLDREITVERELRLMAQEEAEWLEEFLDLERDFMFGDCDPDDLDRSEDEELGKIDQPTVVELDGYEWLLNGN